MSPPVKADGVHGVIYQKSRLIYQIKENNKNIAYFIRISHNSIIKILFSKIWTTTEIVNKDNLSKTIKMKNNFNGVRIHFRYFGSFIVKAIETRI